MRDLIQAILPHCQQLRQRIHQTPELRYEEYKTAALIIQELEKLGLPYQTRVGKTGVVATLDSGKPGKTIAFRADMDALPIIEETNVPYQSQNPGVMHACGHDGHVAALLGVANVLCQLKHALSGKIKFIFQPAEEGGAGALAMIQAGVLENPPVDAIFAFHNYPGIPADHVLVRQGCTMYGNVEFTITINGTGGHAAMPELANNPITVSAHFIQALQKVSVSLAQRKEPIILTITQINSGTATNVIAQSAIIGGTIRAASVAQSQEAQAYLSQTLDQCTSNHHATATLLFNDIYPPTINTPQEAEFVLTQAKKLLGEKKVALKPTSGRASEDFSFFLQKIPGCYFFIGNGEQSASCHNPTYNFNDDLLPTAISLLSTLAIKYLT